MKNKINYIKQQIVFLVCCFSFMLTQAQPETISNKSKISVLTCGIGQEMYTLFGHTALRVQDPEQNLDVVYNWGTFDFNTPNFYSKFVQGSLLYKLDVGSFDAFMYGYSVEDRSVIEQELNLDDTQKSVIWKEINRQLTSEERFYTYGFIRNNCTTKVVDVLNKAYKDGINTNFKANNHSYRYILNEGLSNNYFEKLGINLLFGKPTDKDNNLIFLPIKLQQALEHDTLKVLNKSQLNYVSQHKPNSINSIYTLWAIVIVIALFAKFKFARILYFTITSIFSIALLLVSIYTYHSELHFNILIVFFNPLVLLGLILKNKKIVAVSFFISLLSVFISGLELLKIISPLIFLHLIYYLVLFLYLKKKMID